MKHKFIVTLTAIITVLAIMIVPAQAAGGTLFTDVPNDSPYVESIEAMAELGVVGGVGNNMFAPNETVTYEQLQIMLARMYANGDPKFILLPDEYKNVSKYSAVTWKAAAEIALNTARIACYSYDVFDNPVYKNDAMNAAAVMGLYGGNRPSADAAMTRAECVDFLYKLKTCTVQPIPEALARFKNIAVNDISGTYQLRNMAAKEAKQIPDCLIDIFNEKNFTLVFATQIPAEANITDDDNDGYKTVGITYTRGKQIRKVVLLPTNDEYSALYHELGHVVGLARNFKSSGYFNSIWRYDAAGVRELMGEYSQTNPDNCWAEAFSYMLRHFNDQQKMDIAKRKMPASYSYLNAILEEYEQNTLQKAS